MYILESASLQVNGKSQSRAHPYLKLISNEKEAYDT